MKKIVLTIFLFICSGVILLDPSLTYSEERNLPGSSLPQLTKFQNLEENPISNIIDPELYRKTEKTIPILNKKDKISWSFRTAKSHPFI